MFIERTSGMTRLHLLRTASRVVKGLLGLLLFVPFVITAQEENSNFAGLHYELNALGIGTSNGQVPFWMRTNNYGSLPLDGVSGALIGSITKEYSIDSVKFQHKKIDWGGGAEVRLNGGNKIEAQFITAYLKAQYSIFQIRAGRTKDWTGLVDSGLSSGSFAVSGNALGIPKLEISIPDYWDIPLTRQLIAVKGDLSFGYVGKLQLYDKNFIFTDSAQTYYQQKSIYLRIGKPDWKLKLYGGINHEVFFGNEKQIFGQDFELSTAKELWYVFAGKAYGNKSIASSKIGNHIGSIDQAVTYDFNTIQIRGYHQFFYDIGGLAHLNNIKDGLWGLSLENKKSEGHSIHWHKILAEFMNSTSQGGELDAKITPSGDEDYYNNYIYRKGWTYKGENIGNNFLTNKKYQRKELPQQSKEYIGNNRIHLFHLGIEWKWYQWDIVNKFSYSRNYGTYATSPIGNSIGKTRNVYPPPYFTPVNQFSGYIEASRPLKNNFRIGFVLAGDYGDLLYNSIGGMVKLTKSW